LSADHEWATLFALRVALRNGSVYVTHQAPRQAPRHDGMKPQIARPAVAPPQQPMRIVSFVTGCEHSHNVKIEIATLLTADVKR
jgi:hypothetical protein